MSVVIHQRRAAGEPRRVLPGEPAVTELGFGVGATGGLLVSFLHHRAEQPTASEPGASATAPYALFIREFLAGIVVGEDATGVEFGDLLPLTGERGYITVVAREGDGTDTAPSAPDGLDADTLEEFALKLAEEQPSVAMSPPPVPQLTGELIDDVRLLTNLTTGEIADLLGRTERAVLGWRQRQVPAAFRPPLEALRAIGLTLVGGLGPDGVKRWLTAGSPSALERIKAGRVGELVAEVRAYEDSIAT
jgi:hypothetical protein